MVELAVEQLKVIWAVSVVRDIFSEKGAGTIEKSAIELIIFCFHWVQ